MGERRDVSVRMILVFALALVASAGLIHATLAGFLWLLDGRADRPPATAPVPPPEPRLQIDPMAELAEIRAQERKLLGTYGWVDRRAGIYRIPIERAMELTLRDGLPVREERR